MNYRRIIKEEINRLIFEDSQFKNSHYGKSKDDDEKDYDDDFHVNYNGNDSHRSQLGAELEDMHDDEGTLNYRKLASNLTGIPTSTKNKSNVNKLNSAASALRKKIKGLSAPGGGNYDLSRKEQSAIESELGQ